LSALALLKDLGGWTATLAGDGEVAAARRQALSAGLGSRVAIPGWLELASRDALLASSDVLVLPSRAENLPMVILEAFANAVPVVSTPVGAIPEVVEHGRNGLLVPCGDVAALAQALRSLVDDPLLARRMGEAAREDHARCYDLSSYVERLAGIWREAGGVAGEVRRCA
jgi:glycosyltransferase involved in cell wall biosynthesis